MTVVCRWIAAAGIASAMAWGVESLSGGRLAGGGSGVAWAQFAPVRVELSAAVHLDEVDSAARAHLERVKAFVADQQWDEAVETLRQVMENYGNKVIAMTDSRYVNVWDYCHLQISALPPPALALYRQRVDPLARKLYEEGVANHDAGRLASVLNQFFCSTWGDDALWALGEMSLEQGDYGAARGYWDKLIERAPDAIPAARFEAVRDDANLPPDEARLLRGWYQRDENAVSERWMEFKGPVYKLDHLRELPDQTAAELVKFWKAHGLPPSRLAYPGTSIALADIRARLLLCSILEGSLDRAHAELETYSRMYPEAQGRLEGRKVVYAEALAALLAAAEKWPAAKASGDWTTFGGSPTRSKIAPPLVDLGAEAWPPINLGEPLIADGANSRAYSFVRPGEYAGALFVGNLLLVCNRSSILAFNAKTGKPAWPGDASKTPDASKPAGEIYSDDTVQQAGNRVSRVGVPRFCMTAHGGRLYACMGSQVTNRPFETFDSQRGYLVCLDLSAQGRLMWKIAPDDDKWSFEGAPLVEGGNVYVAMRKSDVRPQAHVACYDTETARLRWRSFVCSAEGPGGGQVEEITHNLLTLDHGMIYFNTNLGAVAALSARDGQVQWATLYPRAGKTGAEGRAAPHFFRDLNPCIFHRGLLLVAPSDSKWIFALDAATGQSLWGSEVEQDVVHLLGVGGDNLIASGSKIFWINVYHGTVVDHWPESTPRGYGRGILAGDCVLWPTQDSLFVLSQRNVRESLANREPVPLNAGRGGGGNLVIADKLLIIATANKLFAYERRSGEKKSAAPGKAADAAETAFGK